MFTGIIEKVGKVKNIKKNTKSTVLSISVEDILKEVKLGDSIAINGVCLTVTNFTNTEFEADVMNETIKVKNSFNFWFCFAWSFKINECLLCFKCYSW